MNIIDFGRTHKGKIIADCPEKYLKWLASHEGRLAQRNRWASRDARFELQRRAQATNEAATIQKIEDAALEGNVNWDEWHQSLIELEVRHEQAMAVRIAEHLVSTPVKVDLGLKGHLSSNKPFSLLR